MSELITYRTCKKCGELKPLEDFSPHAKGKYGRQPRCKACCSEANSARYWANLEVMRERSRLRARADAAEKPEAARERRNRWAAANPEKNLEAKRAWRKAHPEENKAAKEAWRKANKEQWNETGRAWKKNHPDAMRVYQLRKHGLTPESFAALLESQGGKCAICGTSEWGGPGKRPHVDHNHETGAVRGLLCVRCNSGIGQFKESTQRLLLAVDYLVEHGAPGILPETA